MNNPQRHFHDVEQWVNTMLEAYRERIRTAECKLYHKYPGQTDG